MLKNTDIHIRDPFVLPVTSEKQYYLYGTRGAEAWTSSAHGIDYFTSVQSPFLISSMRNAVRSRPR